MTKKLFLIIITILLVVSTYSQQFTPPVDVPILISGNFAELRNNHFHSGVDIRMAMYPVEQRSVRGVKDGYISRISVSPYGFGHALYIFHPKTSQTSVYAHLDSFNSDITEYVTLEQKKRESYSINVHLKPERFPIKKGDIIGVAGNTGSSYGAHLHFELRDIKQRPLCPIREGVFSVSDDISPTIISLSLVTLSTAKGIDTHNVYKNYRAKCKKEGVYYIKEAIEIPSRSYITFEFFDRAQGSNNVLGVHSTVLKIDGVVHFRSNIDMIDFSTSKYVNSIKSYRESKQSSVYVSRAYRSKNNPLKIFRDCDNRGVISISDIKKGGSQGELILTDDSGNVSTVKFRLKQGGAKKIKSYAINPNSYRVIWNKLTEIRKDSASLEIPTGAFYDSAIIDFHYKGGGAYVSNLLTPSHKKMALSIDDSCVDVRLRDKAVIAKQDVSGNLQYIGGEWKDGSIIGAIDYDGKYVISFDTIAPTISPLRKHKSRIKKGDIKFIIKDDFSGISKVEGEIDGRWSLFSYDAKNDIISHTPQKSKTTKKRHLIKITAEDNKGNTMVYNTIYYW